MELPMLSILKKAQEPYIILKNGLEVRQGDVLTMGIIPDLEIVRIDLEDDIVELYSIYTTGNYLLPVEKFVKFNYKKATCYD